MARPSQQRSGPFTYVLTSILAIGLLMTAVLLFLLVRPRPANRSISVSAPVATECPAEAHAPYCYQVEVTNDGDVDVAASCTLVAPPEIPAEFVEGGTLLITQTFTPGQSAALIVRMNPDDQDPEPAPPTVSCDTL